MLPRLKSDLLELIEKVFNKTLEEKDLKWKNEKCLTVVLTSSNRLHRGRSSFPPEITVMDSDRIAVIA